jgi:hypothetical protein
MDMGQASARAAHTGEMNIMDSSGHQQLKWNTGKPEDIRIAKEAFDKLIGSGYTAFASEHKAEAKHLIREFDPTMEELVMVPRNVGG